MRRELKRFGLQGRLCAAAVLATGGLGLIAVPASATTTTTSSGNAFTMTFGDPPVPLIVVVMGNGRVTSTRPAISCPGKCSGSTSVGTSLVLTASKGPGIGYF